MQARISKSIGVSVLTAALPLSGARGVIPFSEKNLCYANSAPCDTIARREFIFICFFGWADLFGSEMQGS
ncbi:MAG: hypothetical protein K5663_10355 [Clostridiales bacterium]|nr:hypothetical protein [Clostridiales bacterium]